MGSPEFSLPILEALAKEYYIVGVVTQPDKPAGRGRVITAPPVKVLAQSLNIPIIQPRRLKDEAAMGQLREWAPDLIVVAAFGQILKPDVLSMPQLGCVNVHASILPRWRGAAPIQASILNGDNETGITIMKMDEGMDTGDILSQKSIAITQKETGGSLSEKLSKLGATLLIETLPLYLEGKIQPRVQDSEQATYAPKLEKSAGILDINQPAELLERQIRAYFPWPGANILFNNEVFKIHLAHVAENNQSEAGIRMIYEHLPAISTGKGLLVLDVVQPAGKKRMPGDVFMRGSKDWMKSG